MSTKIKRAVGNICSGGEIISLTKEEFVDSFQDIIKSYQVKNEYLILSIRYIFISSLSLDKVYSNEDIIFNKSLNKNKLSPNIHKNGTSYLLNLYLLYNISNMHFFFYICSISDNIYYFEWLL